MDELEKRALEYHGKGTAGKVTVVPTKPCRSADDMGKGLQGR